MADPLTRREAVAVLGALALPVSLGHAQQPAAAAPAPDLGNLHDLLSSVARQNTPRLSFLDSRWTTLDDWKSAARAELQARLLYQPPAKPVAATLVKREERDGFALETLRLAATDAYEIPAWVLVPKAAGRRPAIVALHCHGGNYVFGGERLFAQPGEHPWLTGYRERLYGRPWAELLARRGYVVLVIDAFYFGSRRLRMEDLDPETAPGDVKEDLRRLARLDRASADWVALANSLSGRYEHLTAKSLFAVGTSWPGILTWDDKRSVDYLVSRADVDPSRVGCAGLSLGGLRSTRLVAADARIKAACIAGFMTEWEAQLKNHVKSHTWMAYSPGLYASLDLPDLAALCAPGALLVQQCSRDGLFPMAGMRGSVEKIARVYQKAGIADRFRGSFHDQPHSFFPEMQEEAFAWFDRWL